MRFRYRAQRIRQPSGLSIPPRWTETAAHEQRQRRRLRDSAVRGSLQLSKIAHWSAESSA